MCYFDNAASTKVMEKAANEALKVMLNIYGNSSSIHKFGLKAEEIINCSKKNISKILNCAVDEIFFTSGATESINTALIGAAKSEKKRKTIITTTIEHAATRNCLKELKNFGFNIKAIAPKNNVYTKNDFLSEIDNDCFLVSFMHVNNENGLIIPVEEIAKDIKSKYENIKIHVDAAQSFCKLPINIENIDLLSASGHKINSPKGIGLLYIKNNINIRPIIFGGNQQKIRPGTQPTELIKAFEIAALENYKTINQNLKLYEHLKATLIENLKSVKNIKLNSEINCVPYIINISVLGLKSQILLQFLEEKNFYVSSGAACSKNNKHPPLFGFSYSEKVKDSAIRISFDKNNTTKQTIDLAKNICLAEKTLFKYI